MNLDVQNPQDKKFKVEFAEPIGCLISQEGGEFLEGCFHRHRPPLFPECRQCLTTHAHRVRPLSPHGTVMNQYKIVPGQRGQQLDNPPFKTL